MWYIYPTPPFFVNGEERGSWTNQHYSLRSDAQAEAYLKFEKNGINLRNNYLEITLAARDQLKKGVDVFRLFGSADVPKFKSSINYFYQMAETLGDQKLKDLAEEVIELLKEPQNQPKKKCLEWNQFYQVSQKVNFK